MAKYDDQAARLGKDLAYSMGMEDKPDTQGVASLVKTLTSNLESIAGLGVSINATLGGRMSEALDGCEKAPGGFSLPGQLRNLIRGTREIITNLEEANGILNS